MKKMPLTIPDLVPFFQVVIFECDKSLKIEELELSIKTAIDNRNKDTKHYFEILNTVQSSNPIVLHVLHKFFPSWYVEDLVSKDNSVRYLENIENDLLIAYKSEQYLFIHSQCDAVINIGIEAIEILKEAGAKIQKIGNNRMHKILNYSDIQFRTLGIQNIFNSGGTAAEAKVYFSRNAKYSLTPSFDAGYGFSYCLGAITEKDDLIPFGCSAKKSKVWGTWVENIDEFIDNCDNLKDILNSTKDNKSKVDLLVAPKSISDISKHEVFDVYMDYNIARKGFIAIVYEDIQYLDWSCYIDDTQSNTICFIAKNSSSSISFQLSFSFNTTSQIFDFSYLGGATAFIQVLKDNEKNERRTKVDLVEYLNKQNNFTIILSKGLAYRNGAFWEDNRLKRQYLKSEIENWSTVDITKEDKATKERGKTNILTFLENKYLADPNTEMLINDNGANEVADLIWITNKSIVLIHAKYSKEKKTGLRVDDLQVVTSQAIKNLKHFIAESYSSEMLERLYQNDKNKKCKDLDEFKKKYLDAIRDYDIRNATWIVQPGISKSKLEKSTNSNNKIHSLLNFVDSICISNAIEFKFICG
jgi:hypothetical protein